LAKIILKKTKKKEEVNFRGKKKKKQIFKMKKKTKKTCGENIILSPGVLGY
jgi:hypothetical protein